MEELRRDEKPTSVRDKAYEGFDVIDGLWVLRSVMPLCMKEVCHDSE